MDLKLYNTLTRKKDTFRPFDPKRVRMYVCGPTVYDYAHIGNARPIIVFDVLFRLLRHLAKRGVWDGGKGETKVTYVRNITDVDDKINARAAERGISIEKLTDETYSWFKEDVEKLGCLKPTHEPRATEFVPPMIAMIEKLIAAGHAYPADGHVLFDVTSKRDYGKLANRSVDEMLAGARVEVAPYKKNPMDFVLWKPSTPELPGWDSPWGRGRPGWHIECSAMGEALLGPTFDIHGGGIDLVFPHHENEIAQSECAHAGAPLAQVWMHNGFLQVEGEKMAKSAGNFVTVRELLRELPGDILRMQMLMTHYRQPIDWTERSTALARSELEDWAYTLSHYYEMKGGMLAGELVEALCDDLNTAGAITVLRTLYSKAKKGSLSDILNFAVSCKLLGFRNLNKPGLFGFGVTRLDVRDEGPSSYDSEMAQLRAAIANNAPEAVTSSLIAAMTNEHHVVEIARDGRITLVGNPETFERKVDQLMAKRAEARKSKNWREADRIRDELKKMGVELKDSPNGTTWEVAR